MIKELISVRDNYPDLEQCTEDFKGILNNEPKRTAEKRAMEATSFVYSFIYLPNIAVLQFNDPKSRLLYLPTLLTT